MKIRKNLKNILLAVGIIASLGTYTAYAVSASGTASVTLYTPLTISNTTALGLGTIGVDGPGTISVSTAGALTCTGSGTYVCPAGGAGAGIFMLSGANSATVNVTYTNGSLKSSGGTSITFTPSGPSSFTLSATGTGGFLVGGSISLLGTEPAGTYTTLSGGTPYTVTVHY